MQKPLKKAGKSAKQHKAAAPNKHGKGGKIEKKGRLSKAPKRAPLKAPHAESQELTKLINADNEQRFAGIAAGAGGHLALVKPPINATAADLQRKAPRPGIAWGASSQR